jgi:Cu/Ag efflux pump CusA
VLIYLILAAQFESFRDPLIMLITVPMSTLGALAFIVMAGTSINIDTQIGLMTLIGAISNDHLNARRRDSRRSPSLPTLCMLRAAPCFLCGTCD